MVRGKSPRLPLWNWGYGATAARLRVAMSGDTELLCDRVHDLCQLDIEGGDAAGVMGRQNHLHRLVNVAPFRVMIVLFSHQRRPGHEPERLVEILEGKGPRNRLAARYVRPPRQPRQGRFSRLRRQPLRHDRLLFHTNLTLTPNGALGIHATVRRQSRPRGDSRPIRGRRVTMTPM